MLTETHLLFDLPHVLLGTVGLLNVRDLHIGSIVVVSDVFLELGAVANALALNSVDERARPLVESICSAHLFKKPQTLSNSWFHQKFKYCYYLLSQCTLPSPRLI